MITLALLALLAAPVQSAAPPRPPAGDAGLCVRWGDDPDHVADAVVVAGSGDPALDRKLPGNIKKARMRRPASAAYKGQWVGIAMSTTPGRSLMAVPKCGHLPLPKPAK